LSAISLIGVGKHWTTAQGRVQGVADVSFEAHEGTLNVLLGPSGCGKSTTLRLIAGLESPEAGTIHIAGRDVTRLPPAQRAIAMVFQSYALFPHLSVAENILFGLRVRKVAKAECDLRLAEVADLLGLAKLLGRKPSQLSGGQQQRVALGRAIIARAPVCLMDEPLSNLDAQLRAEMRSEIRALQRKLGITMVYVTHDQVEAMSMADRVILMNGGRIEQNGRPVDLYETPANTFVARFIGTPPMNLLKVVAHGDAAVLDGADDGPRLPLACAGGMLGVRPEHIELAFERGLRAGVVSVEYLGADSLVVCRVGDAQVQVRVPGAVAVSAGEAVWLRWADGASHHFDANGRLGDASRCPQAVSAFA
jgi:sn-glycerol 3-phosphate transport system ATP-binding protein